MPNPFFTRSFDASDGSFARARAVRQEFAALEAAFDLVNTETERAQANTQEVVLTSTDSYTLQAADAGRIICFTRGEPIEVIVPTNTLQAFPVGGVVTLLQYAAGTVNVVPFSGAVNIRALGGALSTQGVGGALTLRKTETNGWVAWADRTAALSQAASVVQQNVFQQQNTFLQQQFFQAQNFYSATQVVQPVVNTIVSGAITPDARSGNNQAVVLTTNITVNNMSNTTPSGEGAQDGAVYNLILRQDATGGRTVSWGNRYRFPGGTPPTLSTAPNAINLVSMLYDGVSDSFLCVAQSNFLALP